MRERNNTEAKSFQIVVVTVKIIKQDAVSTVVECLGDRGVSSDQSREASLRCWGRRGGRQAVSGLWQQSEEEEVEGPVGEVRSVRLRRSGHIQVVFWAWYQ